MGGRRANWAIGARRGPPRQRADARTAGISSSPGRRGASTRPDPPSRRLARAKDSEVSISTRMSPGSGGGDGDERGDGRERAQVLLPAQLRRADDLHRRRGAGETADAAAQSTRQRVVEEIERAQLLAGELGGPSKIAGLPLAFIGRVAIHMFQDRWAGTGRGPARPTRDELAAPDWAAFWVCPVHQRRPSRHAPEDRHQ